eukprot:1782434-Amphidinium_carterae.1
MEGVTTVLREEDIWRQSKTYVCLQHSNRCRFRISSKDLTCNQKRLTIVDIQPFGERYSAWWMLRQEPPLYKAPQIRDNIRNVSANVAVDSS